MSTIASLSVEAALRGASIDIHAQALMSRLILSIPRTVEGVLGGLDNHPAGASGGPSPVGGTTHDPLAAGSYLAVIGTGGTALIHPPFGATPEKSISVTRNQPMDRGLADRIQAAASRAFESISGPERSLVGHSTTPNQEIFGSTQATRARSNDGPVVRTQQKMDGSTIIHFSSGHAPASGEVRVTFDDPHHHHS